MYHLGKPCTWSGSLPPSGEKPVPEEKERVLPVSYLIQLFRTERRHQGTSDFFPSFVA